jgi:dTDP-4-dehydrorhamnose 3,5-epimerase
MEIRELEVKGLYLIQPKIFSDERGYFFESFKRSSFVKLIDNIDFVQENESLSHKGTLRGLHMQAPPHAQAKLVRVVKGKVLDVVVDVRKKSETYGKYLMIELSESNKTMLYVPSGFAHGFLTLEDNTIFQYKCSDYYHKDSELSINYSDKTLDIKWPEMSYLVSDKDKNASAFTDFKSPF